VRPMTLMTAVPDRQRLIAGEKLCVTAALVPGATATWWRDSIQVSPKETLERSPVTSADAGTYEVRAIRGNDTENRTMLVTVTPEPSLSVDLSRMWSPWTVVVSALVGVGLIVALAGGPIVRAHDLAGSGAKGADAALIASVAASTGVVLVVAGVFVGTITTLHKRAAIAKLVAYLDRPRLASALLGAGLVLLGMAALLGWRLA
jgi:hypothetical protein